MFDVRAEPELRSAVTEIAYGAGHVGIAMLVDAHGVAVGEAEQFGDSVGVQQVIRIDCSTHARRLLLEADLSDVGGRFP